MSAREEERRRLRRDLHDGLGPRLASLTMKAEAARDLMGTAPDVATDVLDGLVRTARDAVVDVRVVVDALRPPALDALGLTEALRSAVQHHGAAGPQVVVTAPETLSTLPAAVEVAAYRIVTEAVTNAARHGAASRCRVDLGLSGQALEIVVTDDGRGIRPEAARAGMTDGTGVGLASMRERAEELGGRLSVGPAPGAGTRLVARLPLGSDRPGGRPMSSDPTRILVADDHPDFREGMRAMLATAPGLEVVGEAADGAAAVAATARLQPDVVLMDLGMPGTNGIEATRRIVAATPHVAVLVVSMQEDGDSVFAALQAGARGYLLKGATKAEILRSIEAVVEGEAIFGAPIARRLIRYFETPRTSGPEEFTQLSQREREILALVARHQSNLEIARALTLSPKTMRNHVSNIMAKLQVADRAEAIIRAREGGLGGGAP